jgi:hypothetical protein
MKDDDKIIVKIVIKIFIIHRKEAPYGKN